MMKNAFDFQLSRKKEEATKCRFFFLQKNEGERISIYEKLLQELYY